MLVETFVHPRPAAKLPKPRVVIVDDEEAVLPLLLKILGTKLEIVGTASNGREAVSLVLELRPDLLVLDIGIPVVHGLDVVALLNQKKVATRIIFLSTFADRHLFSSGGASVPHAFVLTSQMYADLARDVEAVLADRIFVSSEGGK